MNVFKAGDTTPEDVMEFAVQSNWPAWALPVQEYLSTQFLPMDTYETRQFDHYVPMALTKLWGGSWRRLVEVREGARVKIPIDYVTTDSATQRMAAVLQPTGTLSFDDLDEAAFKSALVDEELTRLLSMCCDGIVCYVDGRHANMWYMRAREIIRLSNSNPNGRGPIDLTKAFRNRLCYMVPPAMFARLELPQPKRSKAKK